MSFESPAGQSAAGDAAPLTPPPFAPPVQVGEPAQGVPQFGAASATATAQYPPNAGYSAAGYPTAASVMARPNSGLPIALLVLCGLYIMLCLVEIFALFSRASLANKVLTDPTSVTIDQANSADNLVSGVSLVAIVVFLALLVVLGVWQRSLRKVLTLTGRYRDVLKAAGYQYFRAAYLIMILLAVVLRDNGNNLATPQDVVSHDHNYMLYFAARAVLGGLLIFLTLRLRRASDSALMTPLDANIPYAANYLGR